MGGYRSPEPAVLEPDARFGGVPTERSSWITADPQGHMLQQLNDVKQDIRRDYGHEFSSRIDKASLEFKVKKDAVWPSLPIFSDELAHRSRHLVHAMQADDPALLRRHAKRVAAQALGYQPSEQLVERIIAEVSMLDTVRHALPAAGKAPE